MKKLEWNEEVEVWMEVDGQDGRLGSGDKDLLEYQNWPADIPIFFAKKSGVLYPFEIENEIDPLFARDTEFT